jgi:sugar/nucleoside kinase (ribokinase family)
VTSIAAIGNLSLDAVAGAPPRPGGTVLYAARALAALRADARIGAACAAADRDRLLPTLAAFGLPVKWFESKATTAYSFHYDGDRRVMRQEAVADSWSPARAVSATGDAGWVHVGALTRTDFPAETLAALADDGRRLLVDAQGLVRTPALGPLQTSGEVGDVLRHVTMLKLDDEEALVLVGSSDPERVRSLAVPEALLTLGSRGCYVVTPKAIEHVPALEVAGPVDPTGAGDTFSATYLARRATGAEPVEAARSATATAADLLSARG